MIVWGGTGSEDGPAFSDGAAYDPATDSWRPLPAVSVGGRFFHSAVWAGTEMLVWGGRIARAEPAGLAYEPAANQWRTLPDAPIDRREQHTAVWSGDAMLVWGGLADVAGGFADGARYDPSDDSWSQLPPSPLGARFAHAAAWSGRDMYVWGGTSGSANAFPDGALYDPLGDEWARLDPFPLLGRFGHSAIWTESELIIWGGRTGYGREPLARGVAYDWLEVRWRGEVDAVDPESQPTDELDDGPPPSPVGFTRVDCRGLLLPPNRSETNTNIDFETGLLEVSYEADGLPINIAVHFLDPACLVHAVVGPIIEHAVEAALEDLESECADLRARVESGELVIRGQPIDPAAIRAHLDRWCGDLG